MAEATCLDEDAERSRQLLQRYMDYAETAIEKCKALEHISGAQKLGRKCVSELKYLKSLSKRRGGFDDCNVRSSNLGHYLGVLHAAENLPGVSHILQAFSCPGRTEPLYADVVAGEGRVWVKVVARKAQALHLVWAGKGQYGERDILFQAEEYVTCAKEHPVNFVEPKILFAFCNGVTADMAAETRKLGIEVLGNIVDVCEGVENMLKAVNVSNTDSDSSDDEVCDNEIDISNHTVRCDPDKTCISDGAHYLSQGDNTDIQNSGLSGRFDKYTDISDISEKEFCDNKINLSNTAVKCDSYNNIISYSAHSLSQTDETDINSISNLSSCGNRYRESSCGLPKQFRQDCEPSHIKTFNQEMKNDSTLLHGGVFSENQGDNIRSTISSMPRQTTVQSGKSNKFHPRNWNPQFSSGMSFSVNEVNASEKQSQTEIGAVPFPVKDGGDNQSKYVQSNDYVTNMSSGELLMYPMIQFSAISSLLRDRVYKTADCIRRVNLDVTALITLVSAVTHGRCCFKFKEAVLSEQARDERLKGALPKLESFLKGKEMFACETAVQSFKSILDTLGGDAEVIRAEHLLELVTVVPDSPSFRTQCLPNTGKIKERSKVIFGTGDSLRAVTLTANSAFVRAARHQGCLYAAHIHPARALTEKKEGTATVIEDCINVNFHRKCELFADSCPDVSL